MFDVCTMGDTAHIDTIFELLSHMCHHGDTGNPKKFFYDKW